MRTYRGIEGSILRRAVCKGIRHPSSVLGYSRYLGAYHLKARGYPMEESVRWKITVSKATDRTLRTFLGARGFRKDGLSRFVEEAVRWRVFRLTVQEVRKRKAGTRPKELQRVIDKAVREVRAERYAKAKAKND